MTWSMHNCVHDCTLAAPNKEIEARRYWYPFDCIALFINKDDWDSLGHVSYAHLAFMPLGSYMSASGEKIFWTTLYLTDLMELHILGSYSHHKFNCQERSK
jgi:hypothetical protein